MKPDLVRPDYFQLLGSRYYYQFEISDRYEYIAWEIRY